VALTALVFALSEHDGSAWTLVEGTEPIPFTADYYVSPDMRFGVAFAKGVDIPDNGGTRQALITDYAVGLLHAGWYSDWTLSPEPLRPDGIEYAQVVLVRESVYPTSTLRITETAALNPGALWMIGNEPEAKYGQGNRTPEQYAQIYHDTYSLIKGLDPTAWIAIGGVVEPTPLRLQWLEMVLEEYRTRYGQEMPIDVWNIHMQILQEKAGDWGAEIPAGLDATEGELFDFSLETGFYDNANPAIFRRLVTEFRQWMKEQGFQAKPLIISEYGVLLPSTYIGYGSGYGDEAFGDQVLKVFMRETFNFMVYTKDPDLGYPADDNRLVQQWLWYSVNDQPYNLDTGEGYNGGLFSHLDPTEMTQFGAFFREYIHALVGYPRIMLPAIIR
jgi:hypothetical protein